MALAGRQLTKAYGRRVALRRVDCVCQPGRVLGVVGQNGAGKSTLMGLLAGFLEPDGGTLEIDGRSVRLRSTRAARAAGVVLVHQHSTLFPSLTVAENLRLAGAGTDALARAGVDVEPESSVGDLSLADQLGVELARALAAGGRYLILDEPTAALDPAGAQRLLVLLRNLAAGGTGIVLVSHKLPEVVAVADDLLVLRDGEVVRDGPVAGLDAQAVLAAMLGPRARQAEPVALPLAPRTGGGAVIRTEPLAGVRVEAGEVLGVVSAGGEGERELGERLAGGGGRAAGVDLPPGTAGRVGYVPADRTSEGVIAELAGWENVVVGRRSGTSGWIGARERTEIGRLLVEAFGLPPSAVANPVGRLSGGQQQRVLLARALLGDPGLLVVAQPTRGVDVAGQGWIWSLLRETAASGRTVIALLSDVDEALELCDRVAALYRGRLMGIAERAAPDAALLLAGWVSGVESPADGAVATASGPLPGAR